MNRDETPTPFRISPDDDRITAVYRCHRPLADLAATNNADVRYCDSCRQKVFRVQDFDGFERAIAAGRCVWHAVEASPANGAKAESSMVVGLAVVLPYRS